jgi:catechol 2,3-dioxygenase-like lactoylglutathione lyase family enzyme
VALAVALAFAATTGAPAARAAQVEAVETIGMTVSDLDRAVAFYADVLSFDKVSEVEVVGAAYERLQGVFGLRMRVARMRLGSETIELTEYLTPGGRPVPADSRSNDRWFQHIAIVTSNMDQAYNHLRRHRVRHASSGPQRLPDWNADGGGIEAFYFRDSDGHFLETIRFPAGKGDPRWQEGAGLFLGIDHTAIVVENTEASLAFYRDALGLRVLGGSENHGTEQEHLNNIFGARLRITTLRAGRGPGIELLEYLAPRDGRPYPADARANDLFHWETSLTVTDVGSAAHGLRSSAGRAVSPGAVALPDATLGFVEAAIVRDPDGHAMRLVERP